MAESGRSGDRGQNSLDFIQLHNGAFATPVCRQNHASDPIVRRPRAALLQLGYTLA